MLFWPGTKNQMDSISAFLLGLIQGLTEFLPVSSSGHIELGKALFNVDLEAQEGLLFTLVVHAATALSTVVVFRKDIAQILGGLLQFQSNEASRFSFKIILSMIPAVIVGLFLEEYITLLFEGNLMLVGSMLLLTALILFIANRIPAQENNIRYWKALMLGCIQAIAILPGISRSGATISSALLLGIDREKAARFSFLMVLPLIFGSMAKSLLDAEGVLFTGSYSAPILGFLTAFIFGIIACRWMIALVKKSRLNYFAWYCAIVGSIALLYELF
jgi:undecaprenyl-diphosphatase